MIDKGVKESGDSVFRRFFLSLASVAGMLVVVATLFVVWSYTSYGDIRSGWLRLGGYQLIAEEYLLDLGTIPAGESKPGTFRLRNLTGSPVVILGMQTDCSCVAKTEFPITIPGSETFDLEVVFVADGTDTERKVIRRMILNLSVDQPVMLLEFRAIIVPNKEEKQDEP